METCHLGMQRPGEVHSVKPYINAEESRKMTEVKSLDVAEFITQTSRGKFSRDQLRITTAERRIIWNTKIRLESKSVNSNKLERFERTSQIGRKFKRALRNDSDMSIQMLLEAIIRHCRDKLCVFGNRSVFAIFSSEQCASQNTLMRHKIYDEVTWHDLRLISLKHHFESDL